MAPFHLPTLATTTAALLLAVALALGQTAPRGDSSAENTANEAPDGSDLAIRATQLLAASCGECHGADRARPKGRLRLDGLQSALRGGASGPAIDLATPDASLLLRAVRGEEPGLEMPPDEALAPDAIELLAQWIAAGAPWPKVEAEPEPPVAPEVAVAPEAALFFEERIRPVLAEHCFGCHGPERDEVEGALRMAGRAGLLAGGRLGPAITPFDTEGSRLLQALRYTDRHLSMPPSGALPAEVVADFEHWIAIGAPWPDYAGPPLREREEHGVDVDAWRSRWPYTPLARPTPPADAPADQAIDAFIEHALAHRGIAPNGPATWPELVRRAHVALHGLPPGPDAIARWNADEGAGRWERLIDTLLAAPEYGEHWARTWLDLVRYADTNGYERDTPKPFAWRYRDYVVASFNADKPYDRFLVEQIAGDELVDGGEEGLVASGFLRLGVWDDEPDDAVQAVHDERDDILRTVGEGFLGLTVGCARCHDHLFDPIPQADYYALSAFFSGLAPFEAPRFSADSKVLRVAGERADALARWDSARARRRVELESDIEDLYRAIHERVLKEWGADPEAALAALATDAPLRSPEQAELVARLPHFSRENAGQFTTRTDGGTLRRLTLELAQLDEQFMGELEWTLAAREQGPAAPKVHVLLRGRPTTPGEEAPPRFPAIFERSGQNPTPLTIEPSPDRQSSGRRLAFARWIAAPENPLTARVMANRVWQHLFGAGIVETPNDFGSQGSGATHPELLDWLAAELTEGGFRLKALQRRILLSRAYQRSSRADHLQANEIDPQNRLLWRQNLRRLSAESVRDGMLAATGELRPGPPEDRVFYPALGRETLAGMSRPGEGWRISPPETQHHRSLYARAKRGVRPALIDVFDGADPSLPIGRRSATTTATQALVLWHGEFTAERARAIAERVADGAGPDPAARIRQLFQRILGREPSQRELDVCGTTLASHSVAFARAPRPIVLRPALPHRLDMGYHATLGDDDALHGPRVGWIHRLGRWGAPYNGTVAADRDDGPVALRASPPRPYDLLRARIRLDPGCEQFGLVLRARSPDSAEAEGPQDDAFRTLGIELRFEPDAGKVALIMRSARGAVRVREMAFAPRPDEPIDVELRIAGQAVLAEISATDSVRMDFTAAETIPPGTVALRAMGEGGSLDSLLLGLGGFSEPVLADPAPAPDQLALEALAQMLFNTNGFVYVD